MNKILITVLLSIIMCVCSYTSVYADDIYVVQLPELPEYNTTDYPYYYIKRNNEYEYSLYIINSDYVTKNNDYYYFTGKWRKSTYRVSETAGNNVWGTFNGPYNGYSDNSKICNMSYQDCNIVYCNFDIKYEDTLLFGKREINTDGFEEPPEDNQILDGIGVFIGDLIDSIGEFFNNIKTVIVNGYNSMVTAINNIADSILNGLKNLLEFLFVPSDNIFDDLKDLFYDRFSILFDVGLIVKEICDVTFYTGTPHFTITIYGKTYEIIDFSYFDNYRFFIVSITSFLCIFNTALWLLHNAPNIIHGSAINSQGEVESGYIGNGAVLHKNSFRVRR